MSDLNLTLIKYGLLIATSPIWFPFLKAVWEEINHALRADGGVFGPLPQRRDRARLEQRPDPDEDPLVSEPRGRRGAKSAQRTPSGGARPSQAGGAPTAGGFARPDRRGPKGFR